MKRSKKLRSIASKFKKIAEQEGVTMLLILHDHNEDFADYTNLINHKKNAIRFDEKEKLKLTTIDFKEGRDKFLALKNTVSMLDCMKHALEMQYGLIIGLGKMMEDKFKVSKKRKDFDKEPKE